MNLTNIKERSQKFSSVFDAIENNEFINKIVSWATNFKYPILSS